MTMPIKFDFENANAREFPQIIVMGTVNVCNLRCIHCPQGQGYPDSPHFKATYISWDLYKKAIDEISLHNVTLLRFASDGEPTVHPEFLDQIAYAKEKGVPTVNLTTNGLTLDNQAFEKGAKTRGKTMFERLVEIGIDVIDISLDAASKETYENVRRGSDFHRVTSNLHRLLGFRNRRNAKTRIMVSIVDQPESHHEVATFVKYWEPLVDRVIVRPYISVLGLVGRKPGDLVDQNPDIKRWPCTQFWKRITITHNGDIRFCVVDWNNESVLGNVATDSIGVLWRGAEYERMRGCHLSGAYSNAHRICGPCTDWIGMRWDWGYDIAIRGAQGDKTAPTAPPAMKRINV